MMTPEEFWKPLEALASMHGKELAEKTGDVFLKSFGWLELHQWEAVVESLKRESGRFPPPSNLVFQTIDALGFSRLTSSENTIYVVECPGKGRRIGGDKREIHTWKCQHQGCGIVVYDPETPKNCHRCKRTNWQDAGVDIVRCYGSFAISSRQLETDAIQGLEYQCPNKRYGCHYTFPASSLLNLVRAGQVDNQLILLTPQT